MTRIKTLLLAALLLAGCNTFYPSEPMGPRPRFNAALNGENELPPTSSPGRGAMVADYLCGPDDVGNDNAELVPINLVLEGGTHPGGVTLTDQQAADLIAGRWYVNIKTAKYPNGEIRGPLVPTNR
jgi:hypothetical protein